MGALAALALGIGVTAGIAAPAHADVRFNIHTISCGVIGQFVHITSTASGTVKHQLVSTGVGGTLNLGTSAIITNWDAGHAGGFDALTGSNARTTGYMSTAGRYCGT